MRGAGVVARLPRIVNVGIYIAKVCHRGWLAVDSSLARGQHFVWVRIQQLIVRMSCCSWIYLCHGQWQAAAIHYGIYIGRRKALQGGRVERTARLHHILPVNPVPRIIGGPTHGRRSTQPVVDGTHTQG